MIKVTYIDDHRRPERNDEYKSIIKALGLSEYIEFCGSVEIDVIESLNTDGVICHSGMDGYKVVEHFAKQNNWPLLSYSGSVSSPPNLLQNPFTPNIYTVDCNYFEKVLLEFIEICKNKNRENNND